MSDDLEGIEMALGGEDWEVPPSEEIEGWYIDMPWEHLVTVKDDQSIYANNVYADKPANYTVSEEMQEWMDMSIRNPYSLQVMLDASWAQANYSKRHPPKMYFTNETDFIMFKMRWS